MDDCKTEVAKYFDIDPSQLLVCRVAGDDVVAVIDRGIGGCPKHIIPIIELTAETDAIDDAIATSSAINLAHDHGIDLTHVTGTGRGGKITRDDVRKVIAGN